MATEQTKSTSIVGMNHEAFASTDKEVECHSENFDATRNRVHNKPEEGDPADQQSYNLDVHENLDPINFPGDSINDKILTEPDHEDPSLLSKTPQLVLSTVLPDSV